MAHALAHNGSGSIYKSTHGIYEPGIVLAVHAGRGQCVRGLFSIDINAPQCSSSCAAVQVRLEARPICNSMPASAQFACETSCGRLGARRVGVDSSGCDRVRVYFVNT